MKLRIPVILFFMIVAVPLSAQIIKPVKWSFSTRNLDANQVELIFKATIEKPWHMYGLNIPEGGPIPASITFNETKGFTVTGKPNQSPEPVMVDDEIFKMKLELHSNQVTFSQRIRKTSADSIIINGILEYMTCSDMQCIPGDEEFSFRLSGIKTEEAALIPKDSTTSVVSGDSLSSAPTQMDSLSGNPMIVNNKGKATRSANKSMWGVFFLSLLAGLGGLLTPCVYPMIPMTVSFFLRGNKSKSKAITEALVFGLSIVALYTLIGVLVAVFKNPNAVNNFTTHWITNLVFFSIFIILSASFFGMFEIMLPSGLANKVDQKADRGGITGAFFMAVAMAVLSFSCTGPIVASLLIKASQGEVLEPIIGMAGFSIVFALPFTLFAIFPSWLQSLPKSGSWLNGVKIFFAFVMLAFSLYFLAKIDGTYHLNLISRNLFLSVWVVIFTLLGFYLLGKIRFPHDSEISGIGFPRFIMAVLSFSFSLYLFTGFLGNDLKKLSTILPETEVSLNRNSVETSMINVSNDALCNVPKFSDFLSLPHNLSGYFDYAEALRCASEKNKPVLVDFVGHTCSNCKKMYAEVWSDPRVLKLLNEKFIVLALYTDDKTKLPANEAITSQIDGKVKNTIGKKNQDLQISRFNSNALPLYAIVNGKGEDLTKEYYTYDPDVEKFLQWLESVE